MSYTNDPVWVNISRPIFSDNVGIVRYFPPLIDGKYFTRHLGHYLYFEAVDASGNSAQCKIIVLVGGKNRGCEMLISFYQKTSKKKNFQVYRPVRRGKLWGQNGTEFISKLLFFYLSAAVKISNE